MARTDITPREAESLFDRLDSWYERGQSDADASDDVEDSASATH